MTIAVHSDTLFGDRAALERLSPRRRFVYGDHGFDARQAVAWSRLASPRAAAPPPRTIADLAGALRVVSRYSEEPVLEDVLVRHGLFLPEGEGIMADMIAEHDMPRLVSVVFRADTPIAHAIIVPTCAKHGRYGTSPVPASLFGSKLGMIAVYVERSQRQRGYAALCLDALSRLIDNAGLRERVCLIAERHVLGVARRTFHVPVVARHKPDRDHEQT